MAQSAGKSGNKVGIVVVTYNAGEFVKICLESVRRYSTMGYEVVVVDNGSEEGLREYLRGQGWLRVIFNEENRLWCEGCNQGVRALGAEVSHVLLLNSDIEVRRADWLQRMVNLLESSERIGIVGTAADRVRIWPTFGGADGQCMMFKRKLLEEIGLLDSERFPWNGADIDYAARAFKRGYIYKIMPREPELVVHYHGMSWREVEARPGPKRPLQQAIDIEGILKDAGLRPWKMPKVVWEIYKRLPGRPFFELTHREEKLVRGSKEGKGKYYGQKL